jgi:hypothetical protein
VQDVYNAGRKTVAIDKLPGMVDALTDGALIHDLKVLGAVYFG